MKIDEDATYHEIAPGVHRNADGATIFTDEKGNHSPARGPNLPLEARIAPFVVVEAQQALEDEGYLGKATASDLVEEIDGIVDLQWDVEGRRHSQLPHLHTNIKLRLEKLAAIIKLLES